MNQDKVSKLSEVGKNGWDEEAASSKNVKQEYQEYKVSLGQRWNKARASKKIVFWFAAGAIILTMFVGFNWGGWVTGGTAQKMTNDAVTQRLSMICVGQFNQDPQKVQKLTELKDISPFRRDDYVKEQGWATMPGEAQAQSDSKVADGCAKLLVQINQ